MQNKLSVLVLAAGEGRRMQSLGADVPKVMLPILGKPVLAHVLQNFIDIGIREVTIVVLEKTANFITEYFKDKWNGLNINYIRIKEPNGPSYALNEVKDYIKTQYFLVQFADSLADENLPKKIIETFAQNPNTDGVLALREVDNPSRYGVVEYQNNQIVSIIEKPQANKAPSNHAVIGTLILKTAIFKKSLKNQKFTYDNQLFPAQYMLKNGANMTSYFFKGKRADVGKPKDLFNASQILAKSTVRCMVFDADNTLYNTQEVAKVADLAALEILSRITKTSTQTLYKNWQAIVKTIIKSKDPAVRSRPYSYTKLCQKYGQDIKIGQILFETFTRTLLRNLKVTEGLEEILKKLPQEKYVVTEDIRKLAVKKLKKLNLNKYFQEIISSEDVNIMKPSKKYYSKILKGYAPLEILVVGDNWENDLKIPAELGMQVMFFQKDEDLEQLLKLTPKLPKLHIMGAAGAGAAAVAGIAKGYGYEVTGCDLVPKSSYTQNLDIKIKNGHDPSHIKDIDLLVISPAIEKFGPKNPEIQKAKKLKIPVITWQQLQGKYLQKNKFVICVAGAYGKSTTTAMISKILIDAGLDPTCEIGAKVLAWGNNFRVGQSKYFVCEGDEYNNNFLKYEPDIAVVLNIAWEHPDFFKTEKELIDSYKKFEGNLKPDGTLILGSDPSLSQISKPEAIKVQEFGKYKLSIIGDFRKENANAALTVAQVLNLDMDLAKKSVESFTGLGRRLEYKGKVGKVLVFDDYAVQPYTIKVTTSALQKRFKTKRMALVLEPHTFSRIKKFFKSFVKALKDTKVDRVFITNVYAAREHGDRKRLATELAYAIGARAKYTGSLESTAKYLKSNLSNLDIILSMGAGEVYRLYDLIKKS